MTILDWLFIGCCSASLITVAIGIFSLMLSLGTNKNFNELKQKRPKNEKKRKRWQRARQQLKKKKQKQIKRGIIFIILSLLFASSGFYARYYQTTNLSSTDSGIIVQGYFISQEVEKNLHGLQNGADVEETKVKLMELTSLLTSYGTSVPSNGLSKEGKKVLNRYYVQMREYGTNAYSLTAEQLDNQEIVSTYLEDLKRVQQAQKKVFEEFGVDETALKQKK